MLQIKVFSFNPFQVNTFILYDETGECAIIDASCYSEKERQVLKSFITEKQLKPVVHLNTHCHIDHILGNNFVRESWNLKPIAHKDGLHFLENAVEYGDTFGFDIEQPVMPDEYLEDGQIVTFGNQQLKVLFTPGHASGSVCLYHEEEKIVWVGDVLFHNSIGRTDLPTGNFDTLVKSIRTKLFTLPDYVKVYPGHGGATSIGYEKENNPFLNRN